MLELNTYKACICDLKQAIKRMNGKHYLENEIKEKANQLKQIKQNVKYWHGHPLIERMAAIVEEVVTAYHADFYRIDLTELRQSKAKRFAWYVHDHGTFLFPLEGSPDEMKHVSDWLESVRIVYGKRGSLYEVDFKYNKLKRIAFENLVAA